MKSIKIVLIFCFIFPFFLYLNGQLASGLHKGTYSGILGSTVNPASSRQYPLKWDVNLVGFNAFGHTDYAYAANTNLFHVLNHLTTLQKLPSNSDRVGLDPDVLYYDFKDVPTASMGSAVLDVKGPSFLINFDKFSVGFFTRGRLEAGTHFIPNALNYNEVVNFTPGDDVTAEKSTAVGMTWAEYGLSLATDRLLPIENLSIGVNLKYLSGYQGAFAQNLQDLVYNRQSSDELLLSNPQVELGFTSALTDSSSWNSVNGNGIGLDLGVSYTTPHGTLNASILDIGGISFSNSQWYRVIANRQLALDISNIQNQNDLRSIINELDHQAATSLLVNTTLLGDQIAIGLPTRLHLDYQHSLKPNLYLGVSIDQRLPIRDIMVQAQNSITIFPRYETKWWMLSLPVTVYEYEQLRLGAAFRLAFLTIGSDHLMSLFGKSDFRGSSFYTSVRIFPFGNKSDKNGHSANVKCPIVKSSKRKNK